MRKSLKCSLLSAALVLCAVLGVKGYILQVASGTWAAQPGLAQARSGASAVLLQDGRILVTGGDGAAGTLASAEIIGLDGTSSAAASMSTARSKHVSAVLANGSVLVAGGTTSGGGAINTAEIYDPVSNSWTTLAGAMVEARSNATATVLQDGRVLIAGGDKSGVASSTIEIFDPAPAALTFSFAGALASPRTDHAMALLSDGRVFIAGGSNGSVALKTTDIYDPVIGSVNAGPALSALRMGHSATTMLDGRVLIAGGNNGTADLASAEIFDPVAGMMTAASSLTTARQGHLAFLLPNNNTVLIVGGTSAGTPLASAEVFTPWLGTFAPTGSLTVARSNSAGSPMKQDGLLAVAGGQDASGVALGNTDLYGFATVKTDAADYPPGTTVNITGAGWQPGESVTLTLVESPLIDTHGPYTVVADANGRIADSSFVTDSHDLNIRFYLTAVGSVSQAQNTFTDANNDATSTTVTCTVTTLSAGGSTSCTATVKDTGGTNGSPTGSVSWAVSPTSAGSFSPATCTLVAGVNPVSTCVTTFNASSGASATVTATYGGNPPSWKGSLGQLGLTINQAPTITSLNNTAFTVGTLGSFTVAATGFPTAMTFSETGALPSGVTLSSAGVLGGTPAANSAGTYGITITASNGVSPSATQNFTLTVNQSPVITSASNTTFTVGTAGTFTVTANGSPAPTFTETGTLPSGVTFNSTTGVLSGTPAAGTGGTYNITFSATNTAGTSPTQNFTLTVNQAPAITSANSTTFTVATAGTFTVTASGSPAPTFTETGTLPSGVTFNSTTGVLSGTPAVGTGGTRTITFSATNSTGTSPVQNFTLTVNEPPAITSAISATFTVGTAGSFNVTSTGFPTPTLSATSGLPTGVTFTDNGNGTGTLSGTPAANTGGVYHITFMANNGVGQKENQGFTLTVNQASSITSANNTTFVVGTAGTFTVTATGFPVPTLSVTGTLPVGVSFNATTGVLSGTPAASAGGVYNISFSAINSVTPNATQSFTLTVNNPSPTLTSILPTSGNLTQTLSVTLTGTNFVNNVSSVSFGADININSTVVNSSTSITASITIPSTATVGTHTVTVTNKAPGGGTASLANAFTVNNPATTTVVTSSLTPSTFGASVTFSATVSSVSGTPTGNVTFYDGGTCAIPGTSLSGSTLSVSGQAAFSTSTLSAGSHTILACYTPSGIYVASFGSVTQVVNQASQTITVDTAAPASATYNSSFNVAAHSSSTLAVSVAGTGGCSGSGTSTGNPGSSVSITMTSGTTACTVTYTQAGNTNYSAATNVTSSTTAQPATQTITVDTAAPASATYNSLFNVAAHSSSTLAVSVAGTGGCSGSGTSTGNPGSSVSITMTSGTTACTVTYSQAGNTNYSAATNVTSSTTAQSATQTITVTGPSSVTYGTTGTATSLGSSGTGAITFSTGSSTGCAVAGTTVSVSNASGTCALTATIAADNNYKTATSAPFTVTLMAATPGLPATQTGSSTYGTSVTLTVTITKSGSGETPTGTIQFQFTNGGVTYNICSDGSLQAQPPPPGTPCVVTLDNTGTAKVTTTKLPAGMTADAITATYSPGDSNYTGGTTSINYTVNMASTMATLKITPATAPTYGDTVTLSSTVSDSTTGSTGTPTGTVQFEYSTDGGSTWINIGDAVTLAVALDGTDNAQTTTTGLPAGSPTIKAVYSGDANFTGTSSGTSAYPVNQKALTVTGITASNRPYDGGTDATLTTSSEMLVGVIAPDVVNLTGTATGAFTPDGNVGNNKTVQISGLTLTGAAAANYTLTQPTTTANITAVTVTVTASSPTVTYGDPVPTITAGFNGFVNGEDYTALTTQPTCTTTYTKTSNAGSAPSTSCSGAVATNYTFNYTPGTVTVNKATATISVTPYSVTYDGNAHTATGTATGVKGESLSGLDLSGTTHTGAGTTTDTWAFTDVTGNYNNATATISDVIKRATATISVTPYSVPYDGNAHMATGTATGAKGESLSGLDLSGTTHTNAGTTTDTWIFTDVTGNYNSTSGTVSDSIAKANAVIMVTAYNVTYDSNLHMATGTAIGVGGVDLSAGLNLAATTHTSAGDYPNDSWRFAGGVNYNDAAGPVHDVINEAPTKTVVISSANPSTVGGSVNFTATITSTGGTPTGTVQFIIDGSNFGSPASLSGGTATSTAITTFSPGEHTVTAMYASDGNFLSSTSPFLIQEVNNPLSSIAVTPAIPTIFVTDTKQFTATGTFADRSSAILPTGGTWAVGSPLTAVRAPMAAAGNNGTLYFFGGQDGGGAENFVQSYNPVTGVWNTLSPSPAMTARYQGVAVNPGDGKIYVIGGSQSTVTSYVEAYDPVANTWTPLASLAHASACSVGGAINGLIYVLTGCDGNPGFSKEFDVYNPATNSWSSLTSPTHAHNSGAGGAIGGKFYVAGGYDGSTATDITEVYDPQTQAWSTLASMPTQRGELSGGVTGGKLYAVGGLDNSSNPQSSVYVYDPAAGTWSTGPSLSQGRRDIGLATFDGLLYAGGGFTTSNSSALEILDTDNVTWSSDKTSVATIDANSGLATGASAGSASIAATSAATSVSGSTTLTVVKKDQTITFNALASKTYGNADFSVSATASSNLTVSFIASGNCTATADGLTVHITAAGTCTITAQQAGDNTYNPANDVSQTFTINKASAIIVVTPYNVTYDGYAHTATGTAKGAFNEILTGLDLSGTTHTSAGTTTDAWTFTDVTGNYNNATGTVSDVIKKATATISVAPYSVTYDGNAHTATGTATGVKGETLSGLDLSGTAHTNAGTTTDTWTFTDVTGNYNNATGTVSDVIKKATATISVAPYSVTYDGNAHTATGTATGVKGETLSGLDLSGTAHTNAGTTTDTWTFTDVTGNYNNATGTVSDVIKKATATISVAPYSMTYDGNAHTATGTATGVKGETLSGLNLSATTHISAGTYSMDIWSFTDVTGNYNNTSGTVSDTIMQATTSTTVVSSSPNNSSTYMQQVTFTATVTPQGTIPTGTVTFYNNGSSIGTSSLSPSTCGMASCPDQATLSISSLPDSGPDSITATYNGDANFVTSTSAAIIQTVMPAPNVSLNPMSVSFGNQNVNTTSKPAAVVLTNIGDATLNINMSGITISPSTDFAQTNNCGTTVAPTKSCTIYVTFTPVDTGIRTAVLQITDNDDDANNAQQTVALTGSGLSTIPGTSLFTDAVFATANGCGAIVMSGGSTVDSFSSTQGYASSRVQGGNVGTNGNVTLNGSKSAIYGSAAAAAASTGNCSKTSITGVTTSGGAQVTGGVTALNGSISYPNPPAPNPAPPTTTQNISGSCGSVSGCYPMGSKVVTLIPGQYGNLTISGGATAHFSAGTYNINSLTLSGQSILHVDNGPVVINLAGASLSGGNAAMDANGGSIENPTLTAENLQITYAGSRGLNLSGGATSYATVYAPNALVNMSGGTDFFGSIIASTVTNSGGTAIHYDSSLPAIASGNYIWFDAIANNVQGLPSNGAQVKLYLTNSSISFTANNTSYVVPVPNAVVTFNSAAQTSGAKTSYDLGNSRWSTAVAKSALTGNTFVSGVAFQVPANFPTGIQNVTWSASYSTDTPGITLQWQWGAAVYSSFSTTYATTSVSNTLGVNPEDGVAGSDPAGTPENYKPSVIFGATGGGGTNYTGYLSAAAGVVPTVAPMSLSPSSLDFGLQSQGKTNPITMSTVLTNNDSGSYTIGSIAIMGANASDFAFATGGANNCLPLAALPSPNTLAAGTSCTLYVTFTPSDVATRTAKIVVSDNAKNTPQTVYLSGTGQ